MEGQAMFDPGTLKELKEGLIHQPTLVMHDDGRSWHRGTSSCSEQPFGIIIASRKNQRLKHDVHHTYVLTADAMGWTYMGPTI
jgi:hypothetical protein